MGIFDKLRHELIDIIEWNEQPQNGILCYRFPRYNNEIKNGAKLIVREGQVAILTTGGKLADVYPPGTATLTTGNMPILSTIMGWKYGFESPIKADVYFVSTKQWTDQKWGTQNPFMMRDSEFGVVRIRAFGSYAFHVTDPGVFLQQLVASDPAFESYEIASQLRNTIVSRFVDVVGQAKIAALDLAGNYDKISKLALENIKPDLATIGLGLTLFYIENISLPPEVEQALDKRSEMGAIGDLNRYTQFQTASAIPDAAKNPGGIAGIGAGLSVGMNMANQMTGAMAAGQATPPPLPGALPSFFIGVNGQQTGPFDITALQYKLHDGGLARTTLVWKPGMAAWTAAESVPELQALFAAVPPPLPT